MTIWETGVCKSNGINIHYTRTGGNKPPVILLHGLMLNGLCWSGLARALENDYDVIMPDARGHGKSTVPDSGYQYGDHANDVTGLITSLKLSAPVLLGHSMGGMTAAVVASSTLGGLRGLILADPTFLTPQVQREVYASDVAEKHRKILTKPYEEVLADAMARHPSRSRKTLELVAHARLQTSMNAFEVLRPPNPDYRQLACKINAPTLLVFGDKGVVSQAVAEELKKINPRIQTRQIQGAGHSPHLDQPERFTATINAFLHSIEPEAGS